MKKLKRLLITFLNNLTIVYSVKELINDKSVDSSFKLYIFPLMMIAAVAVDIFNLFKFVFIKVISLFALLIKKIKIIKYHIKMTGLNKKTPQEKFKALFDDFKKTLDVKTILQWKEVLINNFGEENIQITTSVNEYMSTPQFSAMQDEPVLNLFQSQISNFRYLIIIRFPKVEISNSNKNKATIYDLFVRITIDKDYQFRGYQMCVTSFTPSTFLSGYSHSHMRAFNVNSYFPAFHDVCLGEGPLAMSLAKRTKLNVINDFKLLIYNIKEYVKWESLEGGPFIRIADITKRPVQNPHMVSMSEDHCFGSTDIQLLFNAILEQIKKNPEYFLERADILIDQYSLMVDGKKLDLLPFIVLSLGKYMMTRGYLPFLIKYNGIKCTLQMSSLNEFKRKPLDEEKSIEVLEKLLNPDSETNLETQYKAYNKKIGQVVFTFKNNPIYFKIVNENGSQNQKTEEKSTETLLERAEKLSKQFELPKKTKDEILRELSKRLTKQLSKHLESKRQGESANLLIKEGSTTSDIKETATADQIPVSQGE